MATSTKEQGRSDVGKTPRSFLVVDDDVVFRERLVKALVARGLQAQGASNGYEAIAISQKLPPEAAVIDLRMPGMSGLELAKALIEKYPRMQIVLLTGYGSIATAVEAVRHGAINYLQKPVDTDQILSAFDRDHDSVAETAAGAVESTPSLARVEWEHIQRVLTDCEGNISLAARRLGLHRRSLQRKLGKFPPLE